MAAKTREALDTSLRVIANQDATLRMYRSRITDLEVTNKLLIDALTGVTTSSLEKNNSTNKKENK